MALPLDIRRCLHSYLGFQLTFLAPWPQSRGKSASEAGASPVVCLWSLRRTWCALPRLLGMNMDLRLWIPLTPGWCLLLAWIRCPSRVGSSLLIFVSVGLTCSCCVGSHSQPQMCWLDLFLDLWTLDCWVIQLLLITQGLNFLCIAETWLSAGESSAFTELRADACCFLNSAQIWGRGLAVVVKKQYKCKPLSLSTSPSSFELCVWAESLSHSALCCGLQTPPKNNKDFLTDFSDLLAEIMPKHDHVLIFGDFNLQVCCPDKPTAKDFLNLFILLTLCNLCLGLHKSWILF